MKDYGKEKNNVKLGLIFVVRQGNHLDE